MKRRITFIYEPDRPFHPQQLDVQKDSLQIKSLEAAREERWTASLYELPQEIWLALKQVHEIHIRWATARPHATVPPFASAISPGLHVFLTPQRDRSANLLCPLLAKVFAGDLNCSLPEDVFTRIPIAAEHFASSASLQYYEYSPMEDGRPPTAVKNFVSYLHEKICPKEGDPDCRGRVMALSAADHFDIDYDTISQSLSLSAFWQAGSIFQSWNDRLEQLKGQAKVEVGILANEKASRPEDLSLGGYLITLGEDTKASPTLFSFPSRHHRCQSNYTASLTIPTGLHPTLHLTFPPSTPPPFHSCALHTYITLPSSLFPDKYQLSQPNLLKSHNLASLRSLSLPAPDLEAPVWAVKEWGSTLLLELAPPTSSSSLSSSTSKDSSRSSSEPWHASIPLHLRYLAPSSSPSSATNHHNDSQVPVSIPNPIVFWACPSNHDGPELDTNPFDRTNLGYDGLFGPRTLFYHLRDTTAAVVDGHGVVWQQNVQLLNVPVLDVRLAGWVELGTGLAVLFGSGWVVWCLLRVTLGFGKEKRVRREKRE